jgi:hypothetical protein
MNASGGVFGIGSTANQPFYVDIKVSGSSSSGSTVYDFVSNVCSAQWFSGAGALPCPGTDGDSRGFVLTIANPRLENGTTSTQPGLLTFPQFITNGYIQGYYPSVNVLTDDHFQATLDCDYGAADCFVIFRLDYQIGSGPVQTLGTFAERYDGLYNPVDIDLSPLSGQSVKFILTVLSNGSPSGDRATWIAPHIVRTLAIGGGNSVAPTQTGIPVTQTLLPVPTDTSTPVPAIPTNTFTPIPVIPTNTSTSVPVIPTNTPTP